MQDKMCCNAKLQPHYFQIQTARNLHVSLLCEENEDCDSDWNDE
jgi:hypothetical protein